MTDYKQTRDAAEKVTTYYGKMLRNLDNDTLLRCLRHRVPDPRRGYKSEATVPLNPHGEPAADRIEELEARVHGMIERIEDLVAVNDELEAKHRELISALWELLHDYVDDIMSSEVGDDEGYEIWTSAKKFRQVVCLAELKG